MGTHGGWLTLHSGEMGGTQPTIPTWPPHSSALVEAIRPLGTRLKGSQDTSAPLMAERSNRWATQTAPLRRQRRQHVGPHHQSGKALIVSKERISLHAHAHSSFNRHSLPDQPCKTLVRFPQPTLYDLLARTVRTPQAQLGWGKSCVGRRCKEILLRHNRPPTILRHPCP